MGRWPPSTAMRPCSRSKGRGTMSIRHEHIARSRKAEEPLRWSLDQDQQMSRRPTWNNECGILVDMKARLEALPHIQNISSAGPTSVLTAVSCLTVAFVIAEFAGGVLAHSVAIMTDAGHMLSDLLGFVISITAIRCSRRTGLFWSSQRQGDYDVEPDIMLITAGVGLLFNIIMAAILHFGHYGHSHLGAKQSKRFETSSMSNATPKHIDYSMLRVDLEALDGVRAGRNLHVWSLNMDKRRFRSIWPRRLRKNDNVVH